MPGWIKLHRKILNNPIFLKPFLFQLFHYCLLKANNTEKKIIWNNKEEVVGKGSFITGRKVMAKDIGQTESATYKRLKVLEKLNMISVKSNNKFSVVKVLNYCVYQAKDSEKEQQSNNKVTTKEQQSNTNKNTKEDKEGKEDIPYSKIINYLNEKTGKSFSPKTEATVKFINGRWEDGRTLEDFKQVINTKCKEWIGKKDRDGKLLDNYLRPNTLFSPANFENYLNQGKSINSPNRLKGESPGPRRDDM